MAAINASMTLQGLRTGRNYIVDCYAPDAVATLFTFNPSGNAVATSNNTFRAPEDVLIKDVVAVAGPTATSFTITINGNAVNGGVCRWANQLAALPNRIPLNIPVRTGDFIGALQA